MKTNAKIARSRGRRIRTPSGKITVRNRNDRPGTASRTLQSARSGDTEKITKFTIYKRNVVARARKTTSVRVRRKMDNL